MARHLAANGHQVTVYNRTPAKALAWVALYGHSAAPTPREAAEGAEYVFMCVGNDNDVRDVVYGPDGVLAGAEAGAVLVDHTTASADIARELAEANRQGARLPTTALIDQFYAQVVARGGKRWDTSSLIHLLAND